MASLFSDDDWMYLESSFYESVDEYIRINILDMASPAFHEDLFHEMMDEAKTTLDFCGYIVNEDDDEEIEIIVEKFIDQYFDFGIVPVRSHKTPVVLYDKSPSKINMIMNKIAYLKSVPQPAQRTPEWYTYRNELITASSLSKIFGSEATRNSLIYDKCNNRAINHQNTTSSFVNTKSPMHWGQKYEPVSIMIYQDMYGTRVNEFGCIQHPKYPYIGASPDGINVLLDSGLPGDRYGRMVEIKNIVNREMDGNPIRAYWIQMQIQMETCDLDECDFLETQFLEYPNEEEFYSDVVSEYRGVILYFVDRISIGNIDQMIEVNNHPHYEYMPMSIPLERDAIERWITETRLRHHRTKSLYEIQYWYLADFSCVLVERNREWFRAALPFIKDTWDTIIKERETGYEHRAAKKRRVKENKNNAICLIKLDHDEA